MSVPFLRKFPSGKASIQQVDRPKPIEHKAHAFIAAGGWYLIEVTPFGTVRLSATDDDLHTLVSLDTVNGPRLLDAVDELVERSQQFIRTEH